MYCCLNHVSGTFFRPARAVTAALNCIKKALVNDSGYLSRPRIAIVSDTPSIVNDITPKVQEFAEVSFLSPYIALWNVLKCLYN